MNIDTITQQLLNYFATDVVEARYDHSQKNFTLELATPRINDQDVRVTLMATTLKLYEHERNMRYDVLAGELPLSSGELHLTQGTVKDFIKAGTIQVHLHRPDSLSALFIIEKVASPSAYAIREKTLEEKIVAGHIEPLISALQENTAYIKKLEERLQQFESSRTKENEEIDLSKVSELEQQLKTLNDQYHNDVNSLTNRIKKIEQGIFTKVQPVVSAQNIEPVKLETAVKVAPSVKIETREEYIYGLAQSFMNHCVEEKRYTSEGKLGIGPNGSELKYIPFDAKILYLADHYEHMATTQNASYDSINQMYRKKVEKYGSLVGLNWFGAYIRIPTSFALLLQMSDIGQGPAKTGQEIQKHFGFTYHQMAQYQKYKLFDQTGSFSFTRAGIDAAIFAFYPIFIAKHQELYQNCVNKK